MIRFLQWLLHGCWHVYSVESKTTVDNTGPEHDGSKYTRYVMRCEKCGRMKLFNGKDWW